MRVCLIRKALNRVSSTTIYELEWKELSPGVAVIRCRRPAGFEKAMTKDLQEKLKDLAAVLAAVTALVATVKELREALQGAGTEVWKNWPWYVVPAVVFLGILLWRRDRLVRWLVPRSTVSKREAFHIGRKFLLGREGDIGRLLHVLAEWPLVFLVGESGAGKSSLLERGVLPRLREIPGQIPILINSWGPDWVEGPREALARALEPLLNEPLRKLLGLEGPVAPGKAVEILGRLRTEAYRTPALLFDQLDDYQTRHRDKFLGGPGRTLLSAAELAAQNSFWGEIANLLKIGGVRCLFTTRSDAKIGLESVRFQEPKTYPLDPLDKSAAADLLGEISKEAVDHPERTFERLRERLLDELAADGWVLPIQMQVAFSGLADLRFLSVSEYERQGGLPGLEALYLETRISAAARAVGASVAEVRAVLLVMVDRATRKTVPQPTDRFLQEVPGWNASKLQDLLEKLEVDEVVRRRIDPGGEGSIWLLDHDYLSRGLLELDRRARRWALVLDEAARSYEGARGPLGHWKKLLSPSVQVRLLYERLRGRLSYGKAAAYARLSTVRLLLWLLVPLVAFLSWRFFNTQREADLLFTEFGQQVMTYGELRSLWNLSAENRDVRHAFLETAFAHDANAQRFNVRGEMALQAAIGFNEQDRRFALRGIIGRWCIPQGTEPPGLDLSTMKACVLAIRYTAASPEEVRKVLQSWIPTANDLEHVLTVKDLIDSSGVLPEPRLATILSQKALEVIKENHENLVFLSMHLKNLILPQDHRDLAKLVFQVLLNDPTAPLPESGVFRLREAMTKAECHELDEAVAKSLETDDPDRAVRAVRLNALVGATSSRQDIRRILKLVLRKASANRAFQIIISSESLAEAMESSESKTFLESYIADKSNEIFMPFSSDVSKFTKNVQSSDALAIWKLGVESFSVEPQTMHAANILTILRALADKLSPTDARFAAASVLAIMRKVESAVVLSTLTEVLGILGDRLPKDVAQEAWSLLLEKVDKAETQKPLLAGQLGKLGLSVSSTTADDVLRHILADMKTKDGVSTSGLSKLAARMSDDLVREIASLIAVRLISARDSYDWLELAKGVKTRLTVTEREEILKAEFSRVEKNPSEITWALRFYASFGDRSSSEYAGLALQKWIEIKRGSVNPFGNMDCAEIVPAIWNPKDFRVMDLLKWPTCSGRSRDLIISRLDDLVPDATFGTKGPDGQYHADIWGKFAPWAKKQDLDLESPPQLPDLDKLHVN